jgi:hypothetical protein
MFKKVKDVLRSGGRRSGDDIGSIGPPTNFKREVHVEQDKQTGEFIGLPDPWLRLLQKELK